MTRRRLSGSGPTAWSFGRMLRVRRVELGLTLEGLAELVPCSVQHLSEVERGAQYGSLPLLARIEWALSRLGMLDGWVLPLLMEQIDLRRPVHATSRGWEGTDPATDTKGRTIDAAAITVRVDELLANLRRQVGIGVESLPPSSAGVPGRRLAQPPESRHDGADEPPAAALVEHPLPGGSGRTVSCPPLRLWLEGRPYVVRLVVAEVERNEAGAGEAPAGGGMNRRTFVTIGTVGGLGALGAAAVPARGLVHISSADPRVVDYLERQADRLPLDFWSGSLASHLPRAEDAYDLANALLGDLLPLRDQVRLHRVTARLAVLRAETEVFRGRLDVAECWYRHAAERAMEAGDSGLALWALGHLAMTRAWTGAAPQVVIGIAAEARHLGGGQSGAAAAMVAATEARAHGQLGDRVALVEWLTRAEVQLSRAPSPERVPSVFGYTDAMRALDAAAAWGAAGKPQDAEREARQAMGLYEPWHRIDLQVVRLHLATALADQGRPDEACGAAREALPGPSSHPDDRSGWITHAAAELGRHLEPYGAMSEVQEVRALLPSPA